MDVGSRLAGVFSGRFRVRLGGDGPKRRVCEEFADELGVKRVASLVSFDTREKRKTNEGQIADEVEGLVATKLVGKAQWTVHHAIACEHDGVVEGAAADKAHGAERLDISFKTKRPSTRKEIAEGVRTDG